MHNKLRLPALPVERRYGQTGRMRRNGMAVVAAEQGQAQVQPRGRSGGGHDPSLVDEQNGGSDGDRGVSTR